MTTTSTSTTRSTTSTNRTSRKRSTMSAKTSTTESTTSRRRSTARPRKTDPSIDRHVDRERSSWRTTRRDAGWSVACGPGWANRSVGAPDEHRRVGGRPIPCELVAVGRELGQRGDRGDALADDPPGHRSPGPLGEETDRLGIAIAPGVEELRRDDAPVDAIWLDDAEVLVGGQIDECGRARTLREIPVELVGDLVTPEAVEVAALAVLHLRTHLQPVGLHEVERSQHAVQPRQDPEHLLRVREVAFAERIASVEADVGVAVEGEHRGPGRIG